MVAGDRHAISAITRLTNSLLSDSNGSPFFDNWSFPARRVQPGEFRGEIYRMADTI
jgi:hypothetical protein